MPISASCWRVDPVRQRHFRGSPLPVAIPRAVFGLKSHEIVGTTVTWINNDDEPHTVVQGDKLFKSHGHLTLQQHRPSGNSGEERSRRTLALGPRVRSTRKPSVPDLAAPVLDLALARPFSFL